MTYFFIITILFFHGISLSLIYFEVMSIKKMVRQTRIDLIQLAIKDSIAKSKNPLESVEINLN